MEEQFFGGDFDGALKLARNIRKQNIELIFPVDDEFLNVRAGWSRRFSGTYGLMKADGAMVILEQLGEALHLPVRELFDFRKR